MAEKVDRLARVNELIKRVIADELEKGLFHAPGVLVSITEVHTGSDLRNATVFVSIFGGTPAERGRAFRALRDARVDLQRLMARELGFKHTPVLYFKLDDRTAEGDRVFEILRETEEEAAQHDGK